jgi:hypothetical protein
MAMVTPHSNKINAPAARERRLGPAKNQEYPGEFWRLNHGLLKVLIGRNVHVLPVALARARPT